METLDKLSQVLETEFRAPHFDSASVLEAAKEFLEPGTYNALVKAHDTSSYTQDGVDYVLASLCVRAKKERASEGIEALSRDLNRLAQNGLLKSSLVPMVQIEWIKVSGQAPTVGIVSHVHVDRNKMDEVRSLTAFLEEDQNGNGKALHDLNMELASGDFIAHERETIAASMLYAGSTSPIDDIVALYLAILPKGTVLVSKTPCGITDLSKPWELRFHNPLMADFKAVDLDWVRACVMVNGKLEQFNRFLGIRYIRRDGKQDCSEWIRKQN